MHKSTQTIAKSGVLRRNIKGRGISTLLIFTFFNIIFFSPLFWKGTGSEALCQTKYPSVQTTNTMTSTQTMQISGKAVINKEATLKEELILDKFKEPALPANEERLLVIDKFGKVNAVGETTLHPTPVLPGKLFPYWRWDGNALSSINNPFFGSTDNTDVVFKTANWERVRITAAGNVKVTGNLSANTVNAQIFSSDTLFVTRILPAVGDSEIHLGNSSIIITPNQNNIYGSPSNSFFLGLVKGIGIGRFSFGKAEHSIALGSALQIASNANGAIVIGKGIPGSTFFNSQLLINDKPNSLMVGFNTSGNTPTLFVGPADGTPNSTGVVRIGKETITGGSHIDYKFSVDGKIVAKKIVSTELNWADDELKRKLTFADLDEEEKFAKENFHLTGIPPEEEIKKNGIEMGEISSLQMRKTEQIFLYLFEFRKEMIALKKENEELKKEMEILKKNGK